MATKTKRKILGEEVTRIEVGTAKDVQIALKNGTNIAVNFVRNQKTKNHKMECLVNNSAKETNQLTTEDMYSIYLAIFESGKRLRLVTAGVSFDKDNIDPHAACAAPSDDENEVYAV
jgi:hypothetical protein